MNKNHCKQENIRLGTHGEDYGSWMSNPVFYIIGGIMEQVHRVVLSHLDYDGEGKILDKTTPRLIQFHTLKNAVNPPFLGGFLISGTVAA